MHSKQEILLEIQTCRHRDRQRPSLSFPHTHIETVVYVRVLIRGAVARSGQVCCIFRWISKDHGIKE